MSTLLQARAAIVQSTLTVTTKRIDELRPHDRLLRRHPKRQIKQLARSIQTFGFNVPVLIDRDNTIVAGQGRLLACQELGWTEVPDHLRRPSRRGAGQGVHDRRQPAERALDLGRPGAGRDRCRSSRC